MAALNVFLGADCPVLSIQTNIRKRNRLPMGVTFLYPETTRGQQHRTIAKFRPSGEELVHYLPGVSLRGLIPTLLTQQFVLDIATAQERFESEDETGRAKFFATKFCLGWRTTAQDNAVAKDTLMQAYISLVEMLHQNTWSLSVFKNPLFAPDGSQVEGKYTLLLRLSARKDYAITDVKHVVVMERGGELTLVPVENLPEIEELREPSASADVPVSA